MPGVGNDLRNSQLRAHTYSQNRGPWLSRPDQETEILYKSYSNSKVKYVLCDGNHPANYKGYSVNKELKKVRYPPPNTKQKRNYGHTGKYQESNNKTTNNGRSYASVTIGCLEQPITPTPNTENDRQKTDNEVKLITETLVALMN
ncbi:hypothetical protein EVAR_50808_1 [Eumeta japonica]|uniref:Uncharacterized protein n=1 Tax=Eumeta variegata TaxID=151549 RepID=A0A4C1XEC1_EUMVA|nr:hypothetical protein EVAR_50808_1 [Eumeta japonica]